LIWQCVVATVLLPTLQGFRTSFKGRNVRYAPLMFREQSGDVLLHNHTAISPPTLHTSRRKFIQCASVAATAFTSTSAYAEQTSKKKILPIIKGPSAPFSTTRSYRNIVLPNGLKVVLVKDTEALCSSAALTIEGAGLYSDPAGIPGLSHLMEHIVLSSDNRRRTPSFVRTKTMPRVERAESDETDFEDWLVDNEGGSNGFTAPGFVCFHFTGPHEILPEALERFSWLFKLDEIETTVCREGVIDREIGRVSEEIDRLGDQSRAFYFLKNQVNPEHPFAKLFAGDRATLQTRPEREGIDVATELTCFFRDHYLASKATLVVVGKESLSTLDRFISPFSNIMTQQKVRRFRNSPYINENFFPAKVFEESKDLTQTIVLRSSENYSILDEDYSILTFEWPLSMVYKKSQTQNIISASALGFVLTQLLSRRGPGSLRQLLWKIGWAPPSGNRGIPKFTFPIDTSGFQIMRMEITMSLEGFRNRSAMIAAVFESIRTVIAKPLPSELIKQNLAAGILQGYLLAPRPPDAIAIAVDSLRYGTGGEYGVGGSSGVGGVEGSFDWYLMPSPDDEVGVANMKRIVEEVLELMANEKIPLISIRASTKAIFKHSRGIVDKTINSIPLFAPWKRERITGTPYLVEKRASLASGLFRSLAFLQKVDGQQLTPPYLNPFMPTKIRLPRPVVEWRSFWPMGNSVMYLESASAEEGTSSKLADSYSGTWLDTNQGFVPVEPEAKWKLLQIPPSRTKTISIPLPIRPPEPGIEGAFVVQLLSSLPSTFTNKQLALSNLWLIAFDDEVLDLAEAGVAAGIAYEWSFNKAGLRLSFRGISQTLPSYIRRFCRRLVKHHDNVLNREVQISDSAYQRALTEVTRSPKINQLQKNQMIEVLTKKVPDNEVANQGLFFLRCTNGAYVISQGDVLPSESRQLSSDLEYVFRDFGNAAGFAAEPNLEDILYKVIWKPREASPCLLPGLSLISDSCGRVPR